MVVHYAYHLLLTSGIARLSERAGHAGLRPHGVRRVVTVGEVGDAGVTEVLLRKQQLRCRRVICESKAAVVDIDHVEIGVHGKLLERES